MTLLAFTITGTVEAETIDEAAAAVSAYCDPRSDDDPDFDDNSPVQTIRFEWAEHEQGHRQ